ncbi:hypothetical protein H8959_006520 [Pygathrix nigripes]
MCTAGEHPDSEKSSGSPRAVGIVSPLAREDEGSRIPYFLRREAGHWERCPATRTPGRPEIRTRRTPFLGSFPEHPAGAHLPGGTCSRTQREGSGRRAIYSEKPRADALD